MRPRPEIATLRVFHEHAQIGTHDARCRELRREENPANVPFHVRLEGNDLVVAEDGQEQRYPAGTWSAAGLDLSCGFMAHTGRRGCPRCDEDAPRGPARTLSPVRFGLVRGVDYE